MWLFPALLLFLPGCSTAQDPIIGPDTVRGQAQGSLSVHCRYDSSWKKYKKYWCRGADRNTCEILIQTNASEQLVRKDRVSIRDDQTDFIVTVTMEDLRISDAGIYWCAIQKPGYDPYFKVNVNIDPVLTSTPSTTMAPVLTTTASTMENTGNYGGTQTNTHTCLGEQHQLRPSDLETNPKLKSLWTHTVSQTEKGVVQEERWEPGEASPGWSLACRQLDQPRTCREAILLASRSLLSSIYFKLLVFLEVPLLLGMLSAVLWVNRPQRCSGGR